MTKLEPNARAFIRELYETNHKDIYRRACDRRNSRSVYTGVRIYELNLWDMRIYNTEQGWRADYGGLHAYGYTPAQAIINCLTLLVTWRAY